MTYSINQESDGRWTLFTPTGLELMETEVSILQRVDRDTAKADMDATLARCQRHDALEAALAGLLKEVESFIDMGMPFEDPENGFHEVVMAARAALKGSGIASDKSNTGHVSNPWVDDPQFSSDDWRAEVSNGDTRLGYLDWVQHRRSSE